MNITPQPYLPESSDYFAPLSQLEGAIWLDSGKPDNPEGRYDIMSALPSDICIGEDPTGVIKPIQAKLSEFQQSSDLPFCGGWLGFMGYELTHKRFHLHQPAAYPCGHLWFGWYDWALIQDHQQKTCHLLFTEQCQEATRLRVKSLLTTRGDENHEFSCGLFSAKESRKQYLSKINTIKNYLYAGDCYQVNYTQGFSASFSGSALGAYLALRKATPNTFCAYLSLPNGTKILSLSQERFIRIEGRDATTSPIKGTSPRGSDAKSDHILKNELQNSSKNRAENLMIVDLLRNDFNKNCDPGSVKAPALCEVKTFANVHHLVSTVTGHLQQRIDHPSFILDCFPGGSITGAPKKRAMEIIDELEVHPRGPYCGAIGYFSCNGKTELNISIRTFMQHRDKIHCWAGGGIVVDSEPVQEYEESIHKIGALLAALSGLEI